jgi:hypothetical protein
LRGSKEVGVTIESYGKVESAVDKFIVHGKKERKKERGE